MEIKHLPKRNKLLQNKKSQRSQFWLLTHNFLFFLRYFQQT